MLKICGNNIYWKRKFQKGTLIKSDNSAEFYPDVLEGDFYDGWICPGLVNAHCHLELSHLKKLAYEVKGKGMAFFIEWIQNVRNQFLDSQNSEIQHTLIDFQKEGTFFIGDICNSLITKPIKDANQKFYFRNFWEVFGLNPEISDDKWSSILENAKYLNAFVSLHAPYSCSKNLIEKVHDLYPTLQSIHLTESQEEIEYFAEEYSKLADVFLKMGIPSEFLNQKLPYSEAILSEKTQQYILVHNVFIDLLKIPKKIFETCYFCICPTSNLFLHNQTISPEFIHSFKDKICLGTDSYASNLELSIINEMNYLIPLKLNNEEIVMMATINGYKALLISDFILHKYQNLVHLYEKNQKFQTQVLCG